jgi:hypothetical protein
MNAPAIARLVDEIEAEHVAAVGAARASLEHAARCGELLLQAQAKCETLWGQWVDSNLSFGIRQAEKYARFARAVRVQPELVSSHSTLNDALDAIADKTRRGCGSDRSVEWYTPSRYVESARRVLGGTIDLDPCSCTEAQEQVRAEQYFTREQDGLSQEWHGTIWANPPYAARDVSAFVTKLLKEYADLRVTSAVLLTNAYSDTGWFHEAAAACRAICLTKGRIYFSRPGAVQPAQPSFGSAFFYYGDQIDLFRQEFADYGLILLPAGEAR